MNIIQLDKSHITVASQLIEKVSDQYAKDDFTIQGYLNFKEAVLYKGMERSFENGFRYWGAYEQSLLVGLIAIKPPTHLYNLFVCSEYHNRGVARILWNHVLSKLNPKAVTVFSSTYAIGLYKKLGFVQSGDKIDDEGIICYPMQWEPKPEN